MTQKQFSKLSEEWHNETGHFSTMFHVYQHKAIKQIINCGLEVVPYIIAEMKLNKDGHWSKVLSIITECNPIPEKHYGKVEKMAEDWIKWYDNIYKED